MIPYTPGGHAAYQDTFVSDFLKFYPDPFVISKDTWDYIIRLWYFTKHLRNTMSRTPQNIFRLFYIQFISNAVHKIM